ncbi:RNA-guided endonuclease InsQ/TnpB family protein [Alishewanella tabrizica]|uniref:Transposase n=1 Tax=Alishewanella tabrizica TaxID=671278 RepID=A0ABQ2WMW0_9ALTE|nr:RNA-guided endonuclease TnpB family protein [Alishewanella tabrizica]GGW59367.1 transposase [Alishewanella tabrizica]
MKATKTLQVRVRDKHAKALSAQARQVNFVWNYVNELSARNIREHGRFLSDFDIQKYTNGCAKDLGLHSQTVQEVSKEYVTRRKQFKKAKLRWRKSDGTKRSLGWIPIKSGAACFKSGQVYFNRQYYKVWDSYGLSGYTFKSAAFSEDTRGRWYFNVVVEVDTTQSTGTASVGIDLGCKATATDSNGVSVPSRDYRTLEAKLGLAQRASKKRRVKAIHAKIKNRRKDKLHKYSRKLVNENAAIFIGDVSSTKLTKTKMAKSVLDAGWGLLRTMLAYKCAHAGIVYQSINEAYTTQSCSRCGSRHSSLKGRPGLGIREWTCHDCGTHHDRDINAAKNILALGHQRLAGGIPVL